MTVTVRNPPPPNGDLFIWDNMSDANHDAEACAVVGSGDRTVQVYGTWGTAVLEWHGSLYGDQFEPLKDAQGVVLRFTANSMGLVLECPKLIKPVIVSGSGYDLTAVLLTRR
jgi:hypothetical protein